MSNQLTLPPLSRKKADSYAIVCMLIERGAIWNGPGRWLALPLDYPWQVLGRRVPRQCENSL